MDILGDFFSDVVDAVSDVAEGVKDFVSDVAEGAVDFVSDAGEMAQQTLEDLGEETVEALKEGNLEKAIEQSDLPAEDKAAMQEVSQAFELDKGKWGTIVKEGLKTAGWGLTGIASALTGHFVTSIAAGGKAFNAGKCLLGSVSQMRNTSQNAQSQNLAQKA